MGEKKILNEGVNKLLVTYRTRCFYQLTGVHLGLILMICFALLNYQSNQIILVRFLLEHFF